MSDIRFNTWLHQSGTGGITQVDGGHVGIGTTNPDIAVHTANAKKVNVGIVTANSVYAGNFYGNGSNLTGLNSDKIEEGDTKVEVVDSGDQYIVGEVNGSERLRITSAGKVGIGSDNPQKNLDIYSGQSHGSIRVHNLNNGGTGYDAELSLLGSASNSEMRINMGVNSDPDREQIKSYQSNLIFTTNTDERLRIESGGGLKFTGQGTSIPVAGILHHTNNYLYVRGGTSGLILGNQDNTNTININDGNYIKFETNNGSERLRIGPAGQIGINGANYGSSGQVLTSQGSGAVVQWAAAPTPYGGALDGMIFGGTETTYTSGGTTYKVHTFLSTGFLRVTATTTMDILVVAGGGGSPQAEGYHGSSGGGGAGGMVEGSSISVPAGKHTMTVGDGGAASDKYTVGGTGGDSTFAYGGTTITAKGGGGGADYATNAPTGGSGGGGAEPNTAGGSSNQSSQNSGISGITQYGNSGGQGGAYTGSGTGSGGGGGAGGAGQSAASGRAGGSGRANSITGSSVTYAAGGAGGSSGVHNGTAGTDGRGNGASGASASGGEGVGADGGSGIIIVRYVLS